MDAVGLFGRVSADTCGDSGSVEQLSGWCFALRMALGPPEGPMKRLTNAATPMTVQKAILKTSVRDGGVSGASSGSRTVHRNPNTKKCCKTYRPMDSRWSAVRRNCDLAASLEVCHLLTSQLQSPNSAPAATAWVNPPFAQPMNISLMSALLGAGCVGTPSIAQGAAGTFPSRCFGFHATSFVFRGVARNVLFSGDRT